MKNQLLANRHLLLCAAALLCAGLFAGCDDEETPAADTGGTQDTGADTGNDQGGGGDQGGGEDQGGGGDEYRDAVLRVNDVNVTEPSGVGRILSGLIQREIDDDNIHVLIALTDFAGTSGATTMTLRGDAGEKLDDDSYGFVGTSTGVPATIDANGDFRNTEPARVDFPVRFAVDPVCDGAACPDNRCTDNGDCNENFTCDAEGDGRCVQDIILPLHEVAIEGTLETGASFSTTGALLTGLILTADAEATDIELVPGTVQPLSTVLRNSAGAPNCPEDAEEKTGWCLAATVDAVEVEFTASEE